MEFLIMAYINIAKPIGTAYTNTNTVGKQQYDQFDIFYDDSNVFYDGYNPAQYNNVNKPTGTSYTNIAKPS